MKTKYFRAILCFCFLLAAASLIFLYRVNCEYSADSIKNNLGGSIVSLNKAVHLSEKLKDNPQNQKCAEELDKEISSINIAQTANDFSYGSLLTRLNLLIILSLFICVMFILGFFLYIYIKILRPFGKLEKFAANVAAGNLDLPLEVGRSNTFGAFSWAFDLMRSELKKARANEKEALQAKKTLVATISHDIKTPVASIRAYAEALGSGMASTPERQGKYLDVIIKKADEVARLTDDLFLHAVSDMDKLSIEVNTFDAPTLMEEILDPFFAQYGDLIIQKNDIPAVRVSTDARRIAQVFENIISNSAKYAEDPEAHIPSEIQDFSEIHISFENSDGYLVCGFEDFGGGIPPEDLPFVFDKFYRGKNSKDKKGSGLGLYIVKYILEKTGGFVTLENTKKGLLIKIGLKISVI